MGQTITEKILAKHSGFKEVHPGEFIQSDVDIALSNDITSPLAIKQFKIMAGSSGKVFNKNRVAIVLDHFVPNKDILSAEQSKFVRSFAREQKIKYLFDGCNAGIEHAILPEQGIVAPGDVVIGADSHTCTYGALGCFSTGVGSTNLAAVWYTGKVWLKVPETIKVVFHGKLNKWVYGKDLIIYLIGKIGVDGANYKSLEFTGDTVKKLTMADRFTMSNMAIEAGGKNGIFEPDNTTIQFVKSRVQSYKLYKSDSDCKYSSVIEIDCSKIHPQVAMPHLPSNAKNVRDVKNVSIDQAVIGSCTNGWIEDLRIAAKVLKNRKVNTNVRLLIFPATPAIYRQAIKEGLIDLFVKSGGIVCPPTCGPCLGGHLGILAKGERCIATTNRNFVGRMGHLESEVVLSNPAVAAASAITGKLSSPEDI